MAHRKRTDLLQAHNLLQLGKSQTLFVRALRLIFSGIELLSEPLPCLYFSLSLSRR